MEQVLSKGISVQRLVRAVNLEITRLTARLEQLQQTLDAAQHKPETGVVVEEHRQTLQQLQQKLIRLRRYRQKLITANQTTHTDAGADDPGLETVLTRAGSLVDITKMTL